MATREEAIAIIEKFKQRPRPHTSKMDQMNHGAKCIMRYILEHDNYVASGDIAKDVNVSTARIAALANKLSDKGLLIRQTDSRDLRKTYFSLTQKGIEVCKVEEENFISMIMYVLDHLEENELDEFFRIQEKLHTLSKEYMEKHPMLTIEEVDHAKNV